MENPFEVILEKLNAIESAIEKINATSNNTDDNFMDIKQVASFIGVSKLTVYGMTHKQTIPHFKVGKRLYFKKSDVTNWITSSRVLTRQELNQKADEYIFKNPLY